MPPTTHTHTMKFDCKQDLERMIEAWQHECNAKQTVVFDEDTPSVARAKDSLSPLNELQDNVIIATDSDNRLRVIDTSSFGCGTHEGFAAPPRAVSHRHLAGNSPVADAALKRSKSNYGVEPRWQINQ